MHLVITPDTIKEAVYYTTLPGTNTTVAYYGKTFGHTTGIDWTLPCKDTHAVARTSAVLRALGAKKYYAPNVSKCNAEHVSRSKLCNQIDLEPDIQLFGNRLAPADTLYLSKGEGYVLNPAGCGLAYAQLNDDANVSHLSRRSLLCSGRILGVGEFKREQESVVHTLLKTLGPRGVARHVRVWLRCFIPAQQIPYSLYHEPWAAHNRRMLQYVTKHWGTESITKGEGTFYLDLVQLAQLQLVECGVLPHNINTTDATISGDVWLDGQAGKPRNLQIVVRN